MAEGINPETFVREGNTPIIKPPNEDAEAITIITTFERRTVIPREPHTAFGKAVQTCQLSKLVICHLLRPSLLLSFSNFLLLTIPLITLYFGATSKSQLVAGCYAFSLANMFGISVLFAVVVAYSRRTIKDNIEHSSIVLQRAFLIWLLYCLVISAFLANSSHLVYVLSTSHEIASIVEQFCIMYLPGLFLLGICFILQSYMMLIKDTSIYPIVVCNFAVVVLNAILNYALPNDNIVTGAIAGDLSYLCLVVFLFLWVVWDDDYRCSWTGFSYLCLTHWHGLFHSMIKYVGINAIQWWLFDLFTLLLGAQNVDWMIAHAINVFILECVYGFFFRFSLVSSSQVINAMKEGLYRRTVFIMKSSLMTMWILALLCGCVLAVCQRPLLKLFTGYASPSAEINTLPVAGILPFLLVVQLLGFNVTQRARPASLQSYIYMSGCQTITFIVAVFLLYATNQGLEGVWIGYLVGLVLQLFYFLAVLYGRIQELLESFPFPAIRLYSQQDIEDVDGSLTAPDNLFLRLPKISPPCPSIENLCRQSLGSMDAIPSIGYHGDVKKKTGRDSIAFSVRLWRVINVSICLLIFTVGIGVRHW